MYLQRQFKENKIFEIDTQITGYWCKVYKFDIF